MKRFASLVSSHVIVKGQATEEDWKRPGREQREAEAAFPGLAQEHGIHLAESGFTPPADVDHFVLGIATWSVPELHLMDAISLAFASNPKLSTRISVFSIGSRSLAELQRFIPGIQFATTPVVGAWLQGQLSILQGFTAKQRIVHEFHLQPYLDEIARREVSFWKKVEVLQKSGKTGFVRRD